MAGSPEGCYGFPECGSECNVWARLLSSGLEIGFASTSRVAFIQQPFPLLQHVGDERECVCVPSCVCVCALWKSFPWRTLASTATQRVSDGGGVEDGASLVVLPKEDVELQMSTETAPFSEPEGTDKREKRTSGQRDTLYSTRV